jgi:hypothetical protein
MVHSTREQQVVSAVPAGLLIGGWATVPPRERSAILRRVNDLLLLLLEVKYVALSTRA